MFDCCLTDRVVYMLNIRSKCFYVNKLVCLNLFDRCLIGIRFLWRYGKKLLQRLSTKLKHLSLKGVSLTNLKQIRLFYKTYKDITQALPAQSLDSNKIQQALPVTSSRISQALSDQSFKSMFQTDILDKVAAKLTKRFILGWAHYVTHSRVEGE